MTLPTEVFVVAVSRADGRLPDAEKVVDGKLHLDQQAAEAEHLRIVEEIGPHYGVYQGVLALESRLDADYVVEDRHVSRGLDISGLKEEHLFALLDDIYRMGAQAAGEDEVLDRDQAQEMLEEFVALRLAEFARDDDDYTSRPGVGF